MFWLLWLAIVGPMIFNGLMLGGYILYLRLRFGKDGVERADRMTLIIIPMLKKFWWVMIIPVFSLLTSILIVAHIIISHVGDWPEKWTEWFLKLIRA